MRLISKLTLFLILMATSCELCADVTVPDGTRSHYEHQDYNRNDLYKVGSIHLGDTSGNTMEVAAPDLADDNTVFKFPATNGTNGYSLFTDGSGNTSWGAVLTPDSIPAAGVVKSDGTDLTSGAVDLESEVTGVLPKANGGAGADISDITFPASGTLATEAYVDAVGLGDLSDVDTSGANNGDALVYDESESKWVPGAGGGGGLGAVNFNTNPNATAGVDLDDANDIGDYVASGSGVTVVQATTGLPMGSLRATGIQLTLATGTADYVRLRFRVPETYRGMINQIAWRQALDSFVAGTAKVELYSYSDAYANGETQVNLLYRDSNGDSLIKNAPEFYEEFLTDATREYYELRIVNKGATVGTLTLNDVVIGPDTRIMGAVVGEWESFTPSFQNDTGLNASVQAWKRQVGDSLEVELYYQPAGNGTDSGTFAFVLPDGLHASDNAATRVYGGGGAIEDVSSGTNDLRNQISVIGDTSSSTIVRFATMVDGVAKVLTGTDLTNAGGATDGEIQQIRVNFTVPILEWRGKGTTQMLSQGHLYANAKIRVRLTSNQELSNSSEIVPSGLSILEVDGFALDTNDMSVTVPADGRYYLQSSVVISGTSTGNSTYAQASIRVNNSSASTYSSNPATAQLAVADYAAGSMIAPVDLKAGDKLYFRFRSDGNATLASFFTNFSITRISDYTHGTGVGLRLATAENPGLVSYYNEWDGDLTISGLASVTTVAAEVSRVNDTVYVKVSGQGNTAKDGTTGAITITGLPDWAIPSVNLSISTAGNTNNISSGTGIFQYLTSINSSTGNIQMVAQNSTFATANFSSGGTVGWRGFSAVYRGTEIAQ